MFEQKVLFYKLFSSFKIIRAIKDRNIKTLNLNISTYRQNVKNLDRRFEAIHVRIMHANFQASSFNCVGGK